VPTGAHIPGSGITWRGSLEIKRQIRDWLYAGVADRFEAATRP